MENYNGEYLEGKIYIDYLKNTFSVNGGVGYFIDKIESGSNIEIKTSECGIYSEWIPGKLRTEEVNGKEAESKPVYKWFLEGPEGDIKLRSGMPVRMKGRS